MKKLTGIGRMTRVVRRWTIDNDIELRQLAPLKTHEEIADIVGRTLSATKKRMSQLGLIARCVKLEPMPRRERKRDDLNLIGVSKRIHEALLEHGPMTAAQVSRIVGVSDSMAHQSITRHRKANGSQGFFISGSMHETSGFFKTRMIYSAGPGEDALTQPAKPEIIQDKNLNPFDRVFRRNE